MAEVERARSPRLVVQDAVWDSSGSADVKAVVQALLRFANDDLRTFTAIPKLARIAGINEKTARARLAALVAAGGLVRRDRVVGGVMQSPEWEIVVTSIVAAVEQLAIQPGDGRATRFHSRGVVPAVVPPTTDGTGGGTCCGTRVVPAVVPGVVPAVVPDPGILIRGSDPGILTRGEYAPAEAAAPTPEKQIQQTGEAQQQVPLLPTPTAMPIRSTVPETTAAPETDGAAAPTAPRWIQKLRSPYPRPAVLQMVLACVEELRQAPVNADRCATDAAQVLGLWRELGHPDPDSFARELRLVIEAARSCPDAVFARDIRAEGWEGGTDRHRAMDTICRRAKWAQRLEVALAWEAGGKRSGEATAKRNGHNGHHGAVRSKSEMDDIIARYLESDTQVQ